MQITAETLAFVIALITIFGALGGIVKTWTTMKLGYNTLTDELETLRKQQQKTCEDQMKRDEKQDDEIAKLATASIDLRVAVTEMSGKLDNVLTLIQERMPSKN